MLTIEEKAKRYEDGLKYKREYAKAYYAAHKKEMNKYKSEYYKSEYYKEHYKRFVMNIPPEEHAKIKAAAEQAGESMKGFVMKAVKDRMTCEVIRCKECKWYGELGCAIRIVDDTDKPSDMDFCSFAERKEGE